MKYIQFSSEIKLSYLNIFLLKLVKIAYLLYLGYKFFQILNFL